MAAAADHPALEEPYRPHPVPGCPRGRREGENHCFPPRLPVAIALGMQIEKTSDKGVTTLKLKGEIDLHASPALRAELQQCAAAKTPTLLIDFAEVEYIDSSGLATFIEYVRATDSFGGKIALFGLKKKVRTIFDLVRLNELFTIADSGETALAALAAK